MFRLEDTIVALADKGITEVDYYNPTNSDYYLESINDSVELNLIPSDEETDPFLMIEITRELVLKPIDEEGQPIEFDDEDGDFDIDVLVKGLKVFVLDRDREQEVTRLADKDQLITELINSEEILLTDILSQISNQIANITALQSDLPIITPPNLVSE